MRFVSLGLAAGVILVGYKHADACSPPPCWVGYFTPATGTTVPSNIPALYWQPMRDPQGGGSDIQRVTLTATADPTTLLPFTATPIPNTDAYLIVPSQPLVDGMTYSLGDANTCSTLPEFPAAPTSLFLASASVPVPATLGTVTVTDQEVAQLTVPTTSGSCTSDVMADRAQLAIELSAEAMPWRDALHIEALVDGEIWSMRTLAYRVCSTDDTGAAMGLTAGKHQLSMRATLPGTDLMLTTPAVSFALSCPGDPVGPGDGSAENGGCSTTNGGSAGLVLAGLLVLRRKRRR